MRRKRSRSHKMLWYAMILFKNLQNMFVQIDAKEFPIPCWLIQGTICWYWYQLFPVYQEEREVRFTTPQAQCPDLACTFWVTHCVDVPHKCHRDTSGYCPNSCQLSRCMSLWFFRRCSKTFEGSRRWWNAQRKGSVLMSSAADCCHYLRVCSAFLHSWVICGACFAQGPQRHWLCGSVGLARWWRGERKLWNSVWFNI